MNRKISWVTMLAFSFVASQSACSRPEGPSNDTATVSSQRCSQLTDEFVGKILPSQQAEAAAAAIGRECQSSIERNLDIAQIYIGGAEYEKARKLLDHSASNDRQDEPRRLFYLYGFNMRARDRNGAAALAEDAMARFPENPYSRLLRGVELCQHAHCRDAVDDLKYADEQIHNRMGLGYLMAAYADSGDFDAAIRCLDKFRAVAPVDAFDDLLVYVAVFTYAQAGRFEDAHAVYDRYVEKFPESKDSNYIRRARELLLSLRSSAA
jgi:tetratricopeptide (TPR) repeat protein